MEQTFADGRDQFCLRTAFLFQIQGMRLKESSHHPSPPNIPPPSEAFLVAQFPVTDSLSTRAAAEPNLSYPAEPPVSD